MPLKKKKTKKNLKKGGGGGNREGAVEALDFVDLFLLLFFLLLTLSPGKTHRHKHMHVRKHARTQEISGATHALENKNKNTVCDQLAFQFLYTSVH